MIPALLHLNFSAVLSPPTPCRPMSAFSPLVCSCVLGSFLEHRFPSARIRSPDFAFRSQAHHHTRPYRVSFVRTGRLASGCSPPHLPRPLSLLVTQLPSAFDQSSVWSRGISPPFQVRSRAHERWPLAGWPGEPPAALSLANRAVAICVWDVLQGTHTQMTSARLTTVHPLHRLVRSY